MRQAPDPSQIARHDLDEAVLSCFVVFADQVFSENYEELLGASLTRAVARVTGASAALVLVRKDGGHGLVGTSDELIRTLSELELQADAGPLCDALHEASVVGSVELQASENRWPHLVPLARAVGYSQVTTLPLIYEEATLGVLGICWKSEPGGRPIWELVLSLTRCATGGLIAHREFLRVREYSEQLQVALDSRVLIEQGKGALSVKLGVSPDEAFDILRRYARAHNQRIRDLARDVVTGVLPKEVEESFRQSARGRRPSLRVDVLETRERLQVGRSIASQ